MNRTKLTTESFIKRAKEIHGNKYDYSKVVYKNSRSMVCIICPEHGEFWQKAGTHLEGHGCPICAREITLKARKLTTDDFIKKAREIHGNKYDYSKVNYVNTQTKVCIICPKHGEFWIKPNDHLSRKYGCHKCGWEKEGKKARKTTEEFINEARKKHGDKYDYSKVVYEKNNKKVCIISSEKDQYGVEIGEFWQTPANHLTYGLTPATLPMTTDRFIKRAKSVHGNLYDYSKTVATNSKNKVTITCPIHGDFKQTPHMHLRGEGCPFCKNKSVLEQRIKIILENLGISFVQQKRFPFLGKQSLDFYLPTCNIAMECQGSQHFIESKLWENFDIIIERDKRKKMLCEKNGIKIVYIIDKKYSKMNEEIYSKENTIDVKHIREYLDQIVKKEDEK